MDKDKLIDDIMRAVDMRTNTYNSALEEDIEEIVNKLEQSKSSETTDELIKDIIQGAEDFKNHYDKPYDNNTLKNCLIELRNKIESSEGEGKECEQHLMTLGGIGWICKNEGCTFEHR